MGFEEFALKVSFWLMVSAIGIYVIGGIIAVIIPALELCEEWLRKPKT